ncbi:MAG TPA: zinc-ribbon domain-containing protein [Thermomicrobiales bacterium]|nr:zinc-ribbon domain-containing protein [Thermomicrobiales bacterium]
MAEQFFWCPRCERTLLAADLDPDAGCPHCGGPVERISWLTAALRKVSQGPERRSDLQQKHLALIQAIWTADGMGQRYFEICQPGGMYYSRFVRRVTELICRGIDEGWIGLTLPAQPLVPDAAYAIEYRDPERFVRELQALFPEKRGRDQHPADERDDRPTPS